MQILLNPFLYKKEIVIVDRVTLSIDYLEDIKYLVIHRLNISLYYIKLIEGKNC